MLEPLWHFLQQGLQALWLSPEHGVSAAGARTTDAFFIAGGTLQGDAPSYVRRACDDELLSALEQGQLCYVLTSRQMGKSSLMVRTAQKLRRAGTTVVLLDLTAIGQNLNLEQWYFGLMASLGQSLDLEDAQEDFWNAHPQLSPFQRWSRGLEEVVLAQRPGSLVIFIDEIDVVRGLSFSTDEFFAGIRALYNRRTDQPDLLRLTFCMMGVATPADLIRDVRLTPFNVGRRIELRDFTREEAACLLEGLGGDASRAARQLERVLYWTGGHPYLTQRLCLELAAHTAPALSSASLDQEVDHYCHALFLSPRAQERDDNLLFVRERLLADPLTRTELLEKYRQVLRWPRRDLERNAVLDALRLAGVVRIQRGLLWPRNRIYRAVFSAGWVRDQLPDAERRRQRQAFLRGAGLAWGVALVLLSITVWGNRELSYQIEIARDALASADKQRLLAEQAQKAREHQLYNARINLAEQAWRDNRGGRLLELLEQTRKSSQGADPRGFEWFHLWHLSHRATSPLPPVPDRNIDVSADGRFIAIGSDRGDIVRWSLPDGKRNGRVSDVTIGEGGIGLSDDGGLVAFKDQTGRICVRGWDNVQESTSAPEPASASVPPAWCSREQLGKAYSIVFSPDKYRLATCDAEGRIFLWQIGAGLTAEMKESRRVGSNGLAFSPDGSLLVSAGSSNQISLWQVPSGRLYRTLEIPLGARGDVLFSPDGRLLAAAGTATPIRVWDARTWQEITTFTQQLSYKWGLAFTPDGTRLATGGNDGILRLWDIPSRTLWTTLQGHRESAFAEGFLADGQTLVSSGSGGDVKLWPMKQLEDGERLTAHSTSVASVIFDPHRDTLISADEARRVIVWDAASRRPMFELPGVLRESHTQTLALSQDGRFLASGVAPARITDTSPGQLLVWDLTTRRVVFNNSELERGLYSVAFHPDGRTLAAASLDGAIQLWDTQSWRSRLLSPPCKHSAFSVAYSSDGSTLAASFEDQTLRIWDARTNTLRAELPARGISTLTFSPDGRRIVAGTFQGEVLSWDVKSLYQVGIFRAHPSSVIGLAFTPDGRRLATGGREHVVRLWDTESWQELLTLRGHTDQVNAMVFSPDGRTLATAGADHTIRLWNAPAER